MDKEKIQKAWEKFQNKMAELRKRRYQILMQISEKLDKQHMEALRNKLK